MDHRVIKKDMKPAIPSPCSGVCTMDLRNEYCIGCYRTRTEIGGWAHFDNDEKLGVIKTLRGRRRDATKD
jgi:uncharacterized protein